MKTLKRTLLSTSILLVVFLVACTGRTPNNSTSGINLTAANRTALPAAFTMVAQTMLAIPTATIVPTNTSSIPTMTPSILPTPTNTPFPFVKMDGLRVAYTIGGDLYIQDSGAAPIRLTDSGQDSSPLFSDDGQKIVFFRKWDTEMNQLHVINADGTSEHTLVSPELLVDYYKATEPRDIAFIPGTHLLLLNTGYYRPEYPKNRNLRPIPTNDLLIVNADTGEIKQLTEMGQGGYFLASPNGKWIAVQTPDHVDVIDLQGRFIFRNLFSHSPDEYDCVYYGYICAHMYWKQDSTELILVQPIPRSEFPGNANHPLTRTIWRYFLDGRPGKEIRFKSANPTGEALSVSPDGNWIAFSLFEQGEQYDGVYLGNLSDGTSHRIYQPELNRVTGFRDPTPLDYFGWSLDSKQFIFGDSYSRFIVNTEMEIATFSGGISGWIDNSRYLSGGVIYDINSDEKIRAVDLPSAIDPDSFTFVFLRP